VTRSLGDGRFVELADTRLYVVERGDGRGYPLICVHGGPGVDHHTFADYLDPLAPDVRVILVDLRAHGLSDDAPAATLTLARFAADVVELARALALTKYAVLGHSFGGSVALRLAVDHPAAASALVLSAATPSPAALPSGEERIAHVSRQLRERLAQADTHLDWFHAYIAACFADEHDERLRDYLQRRAGMVVRTETAERMSDPGRDGELRDRLGEVRARTLVLHGRNDRNTPLTLGEQLAHGIPGAELVVFERSGHFPFVEEQEAYLRAIRHFLRPDPS
jgi:proline iminopeptidase